MYLPGPFYTPSKGELLLLLLEFSLLLESFPWHSFHGGRDYSTFYLNVSHIACKCWKGKDYVFIIHGIYSWFLDVFVE